MIESKLIEIRDRGTFIPAIALKVTAGPWPQGANVPETLAPHYVLWRAGWTPAFPGIYLGRLSPVHSVQRQFTCDPEDWNDGTRTMLVAHYALMGGLETLGVEQGHTYRNQLFDDHPNGGVLDVQFLLGETIAPKPSELEVTGPPTEGMPTGFHEKADIDAALRGEGKPCETSES